MLFVPLLLLALLWGVRELSQGQAEGGQTASAGLPLAPPERATPSSESAGAARRGLSLPTAGPGDLGFVTSTAAPGQPTSTPFATPPSGESAFVTSTAALSQPTSTPVSAPPTQALPAQGSVARSVRLLQPAAGATISQQSPGFSAQLSGLQAGDSVALLVGQTQNLSATHRAGVMQPSGDRYTLTLRSFAPGSYWWTIVVYDTQNREVARATARSFTVTGGSSAPTTVPPTRPSAPTATRPPAATATRPPAATAAPATNTPAVPPTPVPPTPVPPTTIPPPTPVPPTPAPPTSVPPTPVPPTVPPTVTWEPPTATPVPPTATPYPGDPWPTPTLPPPPAQPSPTPCWPWPLC